MKPWNPLGRNKVICDYVFYIKNLDTIRMNSQRFALSHTFAILGGKNLEHVYSNVPRTSITRNKDLSSPLQMHLAHRPPGS